MTIAKSNNLNENLPSVSIIVPTLNSGAILNKCLKSIAMQDYPKELIEILIIDGGSTDNTIEVAKKYTDKIYKNPLKTGEAGKAVGVKKAKNDLVALIDSDNLLPDRNWLKSMVEPFADKEIIGSEPWEFTYRKGDGFIDRYCALMGINDPLCYFLGNYDRLNSLTDKWTSLKLKQEDKSNWIKVHLKLLTPTIGANGTLIWRQILIKSKLVGDYLFDIDIIAQMAAKKPVKFAKVKTSIIHLYCNGDIKKFICKQRRRVKDYLYYQKIGVRNYPWQKQNKAGLLKFILSCITILPLVYQSIKGYLKKPDSAWFFHSLACWITLLVYGWCQSWSFLGTKEISRQGWEQ